MGKMRKKHIPKITSIALGLIILLWMAPLAFALEKKIPDPEIQRGITIHKYNLKSVHGLPKGTGQVSDKATVPEEAQPLSGVQFEITKLNDEDHKEDDSFKKITLTTDEKGIAEIKGNENLPIGIYKIHELPNASIREAVEDTILSIPLTNPAGDGWIYDVHIFPKNTIKDNPTIDKFVTEVGNKHDTGFLKENVKWIIQTDIPEDISNSKEYVVSDVIDPKLDYIDGSIKVYRTNGKDKISIDETGYTITTPSKENKTLIVALSEEGRVEASKSFKSTNKEYVQIEFETAINDLALESLGQAIYNGATLEYTNGVGIKFRTEQVPKHPEVHTGGVNLLKVDAKDSNIVLRGAKFKIYKSEADAKQGVKAIKDPQNHSKDWEVTTAEDGTATFHGLAYGQRGELADSASTTDYWIVETKAPTDENGKAYNILKAPIKVTVNATSHNAKNKIIIKNAITPTTPGSGDDTNLHTLISIVFLAGVALGGAISIYNQIKIKRI